MPMGIVSDDDFQSEIGRLVPPPKKEPIPVKEAEVIPSVQRGRKEGDVETPESLRRLIGDEATTNGREAAIKLAKDFGLSESSVSAYSVGANSTSTYNDRPNVDVIKNARGRIKIKAGRKLMMALNKMTPEKLEESKARDLAGIAKDMSAIVRNMEEGDSSRTDANQSNKPAFLVYAPTVKQENHYQTVIAKE